MYGEGALDVAELPPASLQLIHGGYGRLRGDADMGSSPWVVRSGAEQAAQQF